MNQNNYVTVLVPTLCYIDANGKEQFGMINHGICSRYYLEFLCESYQYFGGEVAWIEHRPYSVHVMSCEALTYKHV